MVRVVSCPKIEICVHSSRNRARWYVLAQAYQNRDLTCFSCAAFSRTAVLVTHLVRSDRRSSIPWCRFFFGSHPCKIPPRMVYFTSTRNGRYSDLIYFLRLIHQSITADTIGLKLLANACYDPASALRYVLPTEVFTD